MVRFLRIDPMVSGSSLTSAKISRRALCNSRRRNRKVWSHREEGSGWTLLDKRKASQCPDFYL